MLHMGFQFNSKYRKNLVLNRYQCTVIFRTTKIHIVAYMFGLVRLSGVVAFTGLSFLIKNRVTFFGNVRIIDSNHLIHIAMKLDKYLIKHTKNITRYKREAINIEFSKSGIKQEWKLFFNKDRLLTDVVHTFYQPNTHLRSVEKCKTLEDVLTFLYTYSHNESYVRIINVHDLLTDWDSLMNLNEIVQFKLDVSKLKGSVYFCEFTITFDNGYVTFTMWKNHDFGTYKITGKFDLLRITNEILNNLQSNIDYLKSVKRLEQV